MLRGRDWNVHELHPRLIMNQQMPLSASFLLLTGGVDDFLGRSLTDNGTTFPLKSPYHHSMPPSTPTHKIWLWILQCQLSRFHILPVMLPQYFLPGREWTWRDCGPYVFWQCRFACCMPPNPMLSLHSTWLSRPMPVTICRSLHVYIIHFPLTSQHAVISNFNLSLVPLLQIPLLQIPHHLTLLPSSNASSITTSMHQPVAAHSHYIYKKLNLLPLHGFHFTGSMSVSNCRETNGWSFPTPKQFTLPAYACFYLHAWAVLCTANFCPIYV